MKQLVLMIDDEEDDFLLVKDTVDEIKANLDIIFLQRSDDVLSFLSNLEKIPSLILLDLNMPGKDGKAVLRELKNHPESNGIPIVIFTTSRSPTEQEICMKLQANSFVTKPLSHVQWGAVLHAICALYVRDALN